MRRSGRKRQTRLLFGREPESGSEAEIKAEADAGHDISRVDGELKRKGVMNGENDGFGGGSGTGRVNSRPGDMDDTDETGVQRTGNVRVTRQGGMGSLLLLLSILWFNDYFPYRIRDFGFCLFVQQFEGLVGSG